ncbi:MAG: LysR family transcriptional regulator [Pseudomonadota bacterium]
MDRFEDMRCFLQVVDQGSVTRAAEAMSIAPSAVSRRIKELEARLGAQLLARTTRRMSLTEAGQTFYDRAARLLAELEEAEAEVSDATRALAGTLRVAVPLTFGVMHLAPIFAAFADEHEALRMDLDFSDRQVDLVGEGFDLAVRIGNLRDSSLIARKLCDVQMMVCAAPDFLDRHGRPADPQALSAWPGLCYQGSERLDIWRYQSADGETGSVQMDVRMRANNGTMLSRAAEQGLGVAMQPSFIVEEGLAAGRLEQILAAYRWPDIAIYAVYPQTRHLSAKARALIDHLRVALSNSATWEEQR